MQVCFFIKQNLSRVVFPINLANILANYYRIIFYINIFNHYCCKDWRIVTDIYHRLITNVVS